MSSELPRLYLARHGDTAWTDSHQHTGRTDLPLNERGGLTRRGREILKIVPGRVSTEVDAGLSFDTEGTLAKASAHRYYACMPRHRSRSGVIRWHPICQSSFLPGTATRPGPTRTSTRVEPTCR